MARNVSHSLGFQFNQSSWLSLALSWTALVLIGVALPVVVLVVFNCSDCDKYQIKGFELVIVGSQAVLAAVSVLCISHSLRKYGIRRFLFVDRNSGHMVRFRNDYIKQIKDSFCLLVRWALPCFLLKTLREVVRMIYVHQDSCGWGMSVGVLLALVLSWAYVSTITLTASILFHLVCNLQVIHFDDFGRLLERESDVLVFMEEHIRLRYHLCKISHRFRIFLLLQFLVVTASQFVTLFETTGYSGEISVVNGGDFAVSTIVQVVGIILSLHAATRISHRAQGIATVASRWNALMTCSSNDTSHNRSSNGSVNSEAANSLNSLHISYSDSDLESMDYVQMPTNTQLASYMSSYHRRQAFGMYQLPLLPNVVLANQPRRDHNIRMDGRQRPPQHDLFHRTVFDYLCAWKDVSFLLDLIRSHFFPATLALINRPAKIDVKGSRPESLICSGLHRHLFAMWYFEVYDLFPTTSPAAGEK
ncbi:uncharacterized protein LOC126595208 [Malus sylvestris]|uniref:uncharacterized protein LOC126595208 n=1 Tax=Malus sylvestris TaxID=3752 RepID=UPI0021AD12ED|nr:uncharacterized protein LOC126595208 [Malus sylvestris]